MIIKTVKLAKPLGNALQSEQSPWETVQQATCAAARAGRRGQGGGEQAACSAAEVSYGAGAALPCVFWPSHSAEHTAHLPSPCQRWSAPRDGRGLRVAQKDQQQK